MNRRFEYGDFYVNYYASVGEYVLIDMNYMTTVGSIRFIDGYFPGLGYVLYLNPKCVFLDASQSATIAEMLNALNSTRNERWAKID